MTAYSGPEVQRLLRPVPTTAPTAPTAPTSPTGSPQPTGSHGLAVVLLLMLPGVLLAGLFAARGHDPLLLVGAALGVAAAVALWRRPTLALNVLVFVVLLPQGLLPGAVTSVLVLFLTGLNVAVRLLDGPPVVPAQAYLVPVGFLAAFGVWALLSITWSGDATTSRSAFVQFLLVSLLFVLVVSEVRDLPRLDGFLTTLALAGWFLIACGAWTLLTKGYTSGERFAVFDQNANELGVVLLLAVPGVYWRMTRAAGSARLRRALALGVYLAATAGLIALSESRGSIIALGLLFLCFLCFRVTRATGLAAFAACLVTVVAVPVLLTASLARFSAPADPTQYELGRTTLWSSGIELLSDRPLTGGGIGYGAFLMKPYVDERVSVDYFKDRNDYPAHNPLIEVADDTGVPGLALYTGAFVAAGWLLARRVRDTRRVLRREQRWDSGWPASEAPASVRQATLVMGYLAPLTATAVAVVSTMLKGGGVWDATTTFVLLAMVVIPARLDLQPELQPRAASTASASRRMPESTVSGSTAE